MRETTRKLCLRAAQQTAADGCKSRHGHGREDRKRERSFSGLRKDLYYDPLRESAAAAAAKVLLIFIWLIVLF